MKRRRSYLLSLAAGFALIAIGWWVCFGQRPFSNEDWKGAAGDYSSSVRSRMRAAALELIEDGIVRNTNDVTAICGPSDAGDEVPGRWEYRLGRRSLFSRHFIKLALRFNEHGEIQSADIVVD